MCVCVCFLVGVRATRFVFMLYKTVAPGQVCGRRSLLELLVALSRCAYAAGMLVCWPGRIPASPTQRQVANGFGVFSVCGAWKDGPDAV